MDSSGDLWVYQTIVQRKVAGPEGFVDEFSDTGALLEKFRIQAVPAASGAFAVDGEGHSYVGVRATDAIKEFASDGTKIGVSGEGVQAFAIGPSTARRLAAFQYAASGNEILLYSPGALGDELQPATPVEALPGGGASEFGDLTVNAAATVYAAEPAADEIQSFRYVAIPKVETGQPTGVTPTSLTLHGTVDPEGEPLEACYFEYGVAPGHYSGKTECRPEAKEIDGNEAVSVSASLAGLAPSTARSFRLVAVSGTQNSASGPDVTVEQPRVVEERIEGVGALSAEFESELDTGGLATCYHVEFGEGPTYGRTMPEAGRPPACGSQTAEPLLVKSQLNGLAPQTGYHVRIVASNALGTVDGEDNAFMTFPASSSALADERVYELVSPIGSGHAEEVYVPAGMEHTLDYFGRHGVDTSRPFQAAPDGGSVAYLGDPPPKGGNGQSGDSAGNEYVARSSAAGDGWTQNDVAPPGASNEYLALSDDLSAGVLVALEGERLESSLPGAEYADLYRHRLAGGAFEPLIPETPVCDIAEFGAVLNGKLNGTPLFGGANAGTADVPAYTHALVETNAVLSSSPTAPPTASSNAQCGLENDLYDNVKGRLSLVNVLPNGKAVANATFGRQGSSENGFRTPEISNAISADGSRIFWSTVEAVAVSGEFEEVPKALYARENDTLPEGEGGECGPSVACTVELDRAAPGAPGPSGGGRFLTATGDGSRVFFTDEHPLTKGSSAAPGAPDLYEYSFTAEAAEAEPLTDISSSKPGVHADVLGVVGVSKDGSYVYFVAKGALIEGANAEGRRPVGGQPNLYLSHAGAIAFVATLQPGDGNLTERSEGSDGDWQADPGRRTAEVTGDGRGVVFMSRASLTGYPNVVEGTPMTEVFVYDAAAQRLTCASCNPSGEAPTSRIAPEFAKVIPNELHGGGFVWGSFLPVSESSGDYQPRVISEDGDRVFFDSIEPLVPQDTNGFLDVYEWERYGSGSCIGEPGENAEANRGKQERGCIYLLTSGQSTDNSYLVDAGADGEDVFFVTRADLVKADHSDYDELYDARVDGVAEPEGSACVGTGCQGVPPAPPNFASPASFTFAGEGNPPVPPAPPPAPGHGTTRCSTGKRLSHNKCVAVRGHRKPSRRVHDNRRKLRQGRKARR